MRVICDVAGQEGMFNLDHVDVPVLQNITQPGGHFLIEERMCCQRPSGQQSGRDALKMFTERKTTIGNDFTQLALLSEFRQIIHGWRGAQTQEACVACSKIELAWRVGA